MLDPPASPMWPDVGRGGRPSKWARPWRPRPPSSRRLSATVSLQEADARDGPRSPSSPSSSRRRLDPPPRAGSEKRSPRRPDPPSGLGCGRPSKEYGSRTYRRPGATDPSTSASRPEAQLGPTAGASAGLRPRSGVRPRADRLPALRLRARRARHAAGSSTGASTSCSAPDSSATTGSCGIAGRAVALGRRRHVSSSRLASRRRPQAVYEAGSPLDFRPMASERQITSATSRSAAERPSSSSR